MKIIPEIIALSIAMVILIGGLIGFFYMEDYTTDCYDRHNNKINDLTCEGSRYVYPFEMYNEPYLFIFAIFLVAGAFLYMINDMLNYKV